ncbi:MAG: hypothetical protein AB4290_17665 [Spirulina sp.]
MVNYGPIPQNRTRRLLEALLDFVNYDLPCDDIRLECSWQEKNSDRPRLVVTTTLEDLSSLTQNDDSEGQLRTDQIRYCLKRYMESYLEILQDHRTNRTSPEWHFTLQLWSKRTDENLRRFNAEWTRRHPNSQSLPSSDGEEECSELIEDFLGILDKREEKCFELIEDFLELLNRELENSLFFVNSFLLSSQFLEEFVLDKLDLKDKLRELVTKPITEEICPLISCSEWCRQRFGDRREGAKFNRTLASQIENWQIQVIQYRDGVNLNRTREFVEQSWNQLREVLNNSNLRLQVEIDPELEQENNTGQRSGALLLNMNLWVDSRDLPLARYAENIRLDLAERERDSDVDRLYDNLQEILPNLISKARYSLPIRIRPATFEIEFFMPLDYYNTPLEQITFPCGRRDRKLGEEYPLFINSFERYFDEYFFTLRDEINEKKEILWNGSSDSNPARYIFEELEIEDILYIGVNPSRMDFEKLEEALAIAIWSRNTNQCCRLTDERTILVEHNELNLDRWQEWPQQIYNLRQQNQDLEITLFWDDLYPKPSECCRPLNTNVVE